MKLSDNFTTEEATRSNKAIQLHIDNSMSIKVQMDAEWFAKNILQPLRDKVGLPFIITSWYRSPSLNKAVGGKNTSAHLSGTAIDFVIKGLSAKQTWDIIIILLRDLHISFDQCIEERNSKTNARWVHLSAKRSGNRNQSFQLTV